MLKEHSFGIIPLQKKENEWVVLLVRHQAGHWAFPKGHAAIGEKPHETAARELFEETGLTIKHFLSGAFQEHYFFKHESKLIDKTVDYYLAEVSGNLALQQEEIAEAYWFSLTDAEKQATFAETKRICSELKTQLMANLCPQLFEGIQIRDEL